MKYTKQIFVLLALGFFATSPLANASTITLAPANVTVRAGETFSLALRVNAQSSRGYTTKVDATFTPQVLLFSSFDFDPVWTPLRQPGYDSADNSRGRLTRTAGIPGGFTGDLRFGTAVFMAGEPGRGMIALSQNTFVYNELTENTYTGSNEVIVDVLPAAVALPATGSVKKPTAPDPAPANTPAPAPTAEVPPLLDVSVAAPAQNSFFTMPRVILIAVAGLLLGAGLMSLLERVRRRRAS